MKLLTKNSRILGQVEKIVRALNGTFFEGEIVAPDITVDTYTTDAILTRTPVETTDVGEKYGLKLNRDLLRRPIDEVVEVLLHQLIHLWCRQNNISDSSRNGNYHNKNFATIATEKGLVVVPEKSRGWVIIGITDELLDFVASQGWPEHILPPLEPSVEAEEPKKKSRSHKLECACCGAVAHASKEIHILCLDCGVEMAEVS